MAALMLSIRIAEKTFAPAGAAPARPVFRDFVLEVPAGQACLLAGPSGIGKTTLLAIAAGLDRDFRGTMAGQPGRIGFMFQTPRLLPWETVEANVALAIPHRPREARRWIAAVGLAGHEQVYPQRLSLGMARRAALARALAVEPALLLLDEPFASLDADTARAMLDLIRAQLEARRVTAIIASHEPDFARSVADRLVVLAGAPAGIVRDEALPHAGDGRRSGPSRRPLSAERRT